MKMGDREIRPNPIQLLPPETRPGAVNDRPRSHRRVFADGLAVCLILFSWFLNVRPVASELGHVYPFWDRTLPLSLIVAAAASVLLARGRWPIAASVACGVGLGVRVLTYLVLSY